MLFHSAAWLAWSLPPRTSSAPARLFESGEGDAPLKWEGPCELFGWVFATDLTLVELAKRTCFAVLSCVGHGLRRAGCGVATTSWLVEARLSNLAR